MKTERRRKLRCLVRDGAMVLKAGIDGIIWSSGVRFGMLWWISGTHGSGVLNDQRQVNDSFDRSL